MRIVSALTHAGISLSRHQILRLSDKAERRHKWMLYYLSHDRDAALTCRHFDICVSTFYRWLGRLRRRGVDQQQRTHLSPPRDEARQPDDGGHGGADGGALPERDQPDAIPRRDGRPGGDDPLGARTADLRRRAALPAGTGSDAWHPHGGGQHQLRRILTCCLCHRQGRLPAASTNDARRPPGLLQRDPVAGRYCRGADHRLQRGHARTDPPCSLSGHSWPSASRRWAWCGIGCGRKGQAGVGRRR